MDNEFEQMCKDAGIDDLDRPWVETFYNAGFRSGLRRAAEIVRAEQYLDPEGNAEAIEAEATKLEREGV